MEKDIVNLKPLGGASKLTEYNLFIDKKPCKVKLPDLGKELTFEVEVDGKSIIVELSEDICYGKPFFINVGGKPYRVELNSDGVGTSITVKVDGVSYSAQMKNKSQVISQAFRLNLPAVEKKVVKTQTLDKSVVSACMPGKVVLLKVKTRDRVHVGDVLLVLESMKMENEIVSQVSGIVKEVKVSEGAAVTLGEILVTISES